MRSSVAKALRLAPAVMAALVVACVDAPRVVSPLLLPGDPALAVVGKPDLGDRQSFEGELWICKDGTPSSAAFGFTYTVVDRSSTVVASGAASVTVGTCALVARVPTTISGVYFATVTEQSPPPDWSLTGIVREYATVVANPPAPTIDLATRTISNARLTNDFGVVVTFTNVYDPPVGRIGDFVWADANGNGIQNAGETGIAGKTVTLSQSGNVVAATTTGGNGDYLFSGLAAGCYVVTVATPSGYAPSPTGQGTSTTDSNGSPAQVCLATNGSQNLTIDFGFVLVPPPPVGATLLIIDEDGIDNGLHLNRTGGAITPSGPSFWTDYEVNDDIAANGMRNVLRYFAAPANLGRTITVRTGQTGDEGWFAPACIPRKWLSGAESNTNNTCLAGADRAKAINNYVFSGKKPFPSAPASLSLPQARLDKIPHVMPLRARGLVSLIGRDVCAVVYDSDISINYDHGTSLGVNGNLQGATLGLAAFRVDQVRTLNNFSSSTLPEVQITVLDAAQACQSFQLFNAPVPNSSSEPNDRVVENLAGVGSNSYRSLKVFSSQPTFF